ncbi:MAG: hypothetical protein P8168_03305 [Deltaproteobacteria bacterium]
MGVDGSQITTSLDYLLKNPASIDPGHKHTRASISGLLQSDVSGLVDALAAKLPIATYQDPGSIDPGHEHTRTSISGLLASDVGLGNVTNDAQMKRAAGDFADFSEKATPVNADLLLVEDSENGGAKKKVQVGNLPGGGSGDGDVTGPASATDSNFVAFDGATGKLIKDSTAKASDFEPADVAIQAHITATSGNPHEVSKSDVGLGNVPNLDTSNPSNILQDSTHRFVSDSEKSTWNSKQDALGFTPVPETRSVAGHALTSDLVISKGDVGLGNVPNLDTSNPANITQDSTHRFVSDAEKSTWNAKQDALGFEPVPDTRTVAGHPLTANVIISKSDVGLGNVPNVDATDPTNISEDSIHRFATDAEKSTWNGKQDPPSEGAFQDGDKTKLDGIAAGAEVNVQSDWDAVAGDAQILNRPTLGTAATKDVGTGADEVASGDHNHSGVYESANTNIQTHITATSGNPHQVSKSDVGLGNVTDDAQVKLSGAYSDPSWLTGLNASKLLAGTGAVTLEAGGTNQNIVLSPSGTGYVVLNGNVGIGNSTPGVKLEVTGSGDAPSFMVNAPDVANAPAFSLYLPLSTNMTSGKAFQIKVNGESFGRVLFYSDGKFALGPGNTNRDTVLSRYSANTFRISSDGANGAANLIVNGKIGIGTTSPNAAALLHLASTTKGFLPPVMTVAQKTAISSPPEGLVVYDSDLQKLCVFTGSAWETLTSA